MDYMIDSTNLNAVEGTKKSDYSALAQRVTQAEGTLNSIGTRVSNLENKTWALAGSVNFGTAGSVAAFYLDVPVNGKQDLFIRIDSGKSSAQGKYNIGFFVPIAALTGTTAQDRLTLATIQAAASNHFTVDAFIYSANVVRLNTIQVNGLSPDTGCTVYAYTR